MQPSLRQAESHHDVAPSINSITNTLLDLPPSCVEFAPCHQEYFVVGTYYLEPNEEHDGWDKEAEQARSGSLILFQLQGHNLSQLQMVPTPSAILDLHFSKHKPNVFAIATSTGSVCLYSLEITNRINCSIKEFFSIQVADTSILVLSLAWSPSSAQPSTLAVSLSNGQVGILDYMTPKNPPSMLQAHSLEAWTVAWSSVSETDKPRMLYSGGDDSAICRHGEEMFKPELEFDGEPSLENAYDPVWCDTKTHGAGVTAILPVATEIAGEEVLLTGSYDEFLRVLVPVAKSTRSKVLAEKRLGGGVWRLKLLKTTELTLDGQLILKVLASSMHAGARIVEVSRSKDHEWTIGITAMFEEHKSMNYANDARFELGDDGAETATCVSTSFYDRKLCVWKTQLVSQASLTY